MNYFGKFKGLFLIGIVALVFGNSCDVINPDEQIPAFVFFESVNFEAGLDQGTNDQNFPFAEILTGDMNLGIHGVPSRVPILLEGEHTLDVFPGISENGITSFPNTYSPLKFDEITLNLVPGQVDTVQINAVYRDNLSFPIVEPFESNLQVFRVDVDDDLETKIVVSDDQPFEGNRSGQIILTKDHPRIDVASTRSSVFPPEGSPVYLEMNYRTELEFAVGVYWNTIGAGQQSSFTNFINPKSDWNKIYINLSDIFNFIISENGVTDWQIGISSQMPLENGEFIDASRNIWVDNIKLIHLEP